MNFGSKVLAKYLIAAILTAFVGSASALADEFQVQELIKRAIAKKFMGARIELTSDVAWHGEIRPDRIDEVTILSDNQKGEIQFRAVHGDQRLDGSVSFEAKMPAWIANRRILPSEPLSKDLFTIQDVVVSTGLAREYRGVILDTETDLSRLEARQTILENTFAMTTAVQRVPDVRRGETVRMRLIKGGVTLTTTGTAQEPAYLNRQVRVISTKTKQDFSGKLKERGLIEVQL